MSTSADFDHPDIVLVPCGPMLVRGADRPGRGRHGAPGRPAGLGAVPLRQVAPQAVVRRHAQGHPASLGRRRPWLDTLQHPARGRGLLRGCGRERTADHAFRRDHVGPQRIAAPDASTGGTSLRGRCPRADHPGGWLRRAGSTVRGAPLLAAAGMRWPSTTRRSLAPASPRRSS